jgi:hypothetical protein
MAFEKGNRANPGGRKKGAIISPVTLKACREHYETLVKLCQSPEGWDSLKEYYDAVMKLMSFEHVELIGKPIERISAEVSGGMTFTVRVEGRQLSKGISPLGSGPDS